MKLIVGLGNPEQKYLPTLHNVGWRIVEILAQAASWTNFSARSRICRLPQTDTLLLRPQTFMNESGESVREVVEYYKIALPDLWVVHDDLDLPAGQGRLSFDSSSAGHRGVQSIIDALGTKTFWRFRVGIGRPPQNTPAEDYVLQVASNEIANLLQTSERVAVTAIEQALKNGI
ncbi:MAG: aminoacyl-tRNA hydrolase, partial [Candidatus Veblenbacteria bacterium]|nr:aminoacyl-tRNA hydrolase [Candidatus Veblenbacteria bacterium]